MRTPEITAQLASGDEAYVALSHYGRVERGLNNGPCIAEIWRTTDRGRSWQRLPWRRSAHVLISHAIFATWPPEWVNKMWLAGAGLEIEVFEDEGTTSPETTIWRATWNGTRWHVRFDRLWNLDVDGPIPPPRLELHLPGITTPPNFGPFR